MKIDRSGINTKLNVKTVFFVSMHEGGVLEMKAWLKKTGIGFGVCFLSSCVRKKLA